MTTLLVSALIAWIFLSVLIVVSVSMMSSRISRMEEDRLEAPVIELAPAGSASSSSSRIPTQPRAEVVR